MVLGERSDDVGGERSVVDSWTKACTRVLARSRSTTLTAVVAVLGGVVMVMGQRPLDVAASVVSAVCCLALGTSMVRSRVTPDEQRVWRAFGGAAVAVGGGLLAEALLDVLIDYGRVGESWSGSAFAVAAIVFSSSLYAGVVIWNPRRSDDSDRGDWLNGVCAVLVLIALGGVAIRSFEVATFSWGSLPSGLWLMHLALLVILGGSALTVARLKGPGAGSRLRVLSGVGGRGSPHAQT